MCACVCVCLSVCLSVCVRAGVRYDLRDRQIWTGTWKKITCQIALITDCPTESKEENGINQNDHNILLIDPFVILSRVYLYNDNLARRIEPRK